MMLGKLLVPGRPTIRITVGQGPTALAVCAGGLGLFGHFLLSSILSSSFSLSLGRLKYCLKGLLNPKPTNQINSLCAEKSR